MTVIDAFFNTPIVPFGLIVVVILWAVLKKKPTAQDYLNTYREQVDEKAWGIFAKTNDCPHKTPVWDEKYSYMVEPCGKTSTGGWKLCQAAQKFYHEARRVALDSV